MRPLTQRKLESYENGSIFMGNLKGRFMQRLQFLKNIMKTTFKTINFKLTSIFNFLLKNMFKAINLFKILEITFLL